MISLRLSADDLARTRVAYSPLWEAVSSFSCVDRPEKCGVRYPAWCAAVAPALRGLDVEPLRVLLHGDGYVPDFLLPVPGGRSSFAEELARVRAADPARVRAEVRLAYPSETPAALVPYLERPEEAVARLCAVLAAYWARAVEPHWPRMRTLLDAELVARAAAVARRGPEGVFAGIDPRVRWRAPVLEVEKHMEASLDASGRGLLLVPVVFGNAAAYVSFDGPWPPTVAYTPRGVGALWSASARADAGEDGEPLELLLGRSRAAVLAALARPASTSALALRLGLSPSTVSGHLAVLDRAGIVSRRRAGRAVLYALTETGEELVSLLVRAEASRTVA
jgi:DNA-binding transcriptional ArsR family regulator